VTRLATPLVIVLATVLLGCAAAPVTSPQDTPTDRRTVRLDGGDWTVLVAPPDGMRGRAGFDGADGMLFDLGREVDPREVVFVMDGVGFPLDIAWFAADGRLVGSATMPTCPAAPCPHHAPESPYRWAIEAPAGAFDDLASGARLEAS
jgi:uncharacterized membrane protein (UPF0127 family)